MAFYIPNVWYAVYPKCGIARVRDSPYLCTDRTNIIIYNNMVSKIYVNGELKEVELPVNVTKLIEQLLVENPEMVSVQVNEEFAERDDWDNIIVKEGDKVDFLYFMGGGISPLS